MRCETRAFLKSADCKVRVPEPPWTLGMTVYVCLFHLLDKFSKAADSISRKASVGQIPQPLSNINTVPSAPIDPRVDMKQGGAC